MMRAIIVVVAMAMVAVSAQAQVAMNVPGIELLSDYGLPVNGYQTDFTSGFDPADWGRLGDTTWDIVNGVLTFSGNVQGVVAPGWAAHVSYMPSRVVGYQEVLIRARIAPSGNGWNGALVYDYDGFFGLQLFPNTGDNDFVLYWDGMSARKTMEGPERNPAEDWVWMRLAYDYGKLEMYASVWLADGETEEPDSWMATWSGVTAWYSEYPEGCCAGLLVQGPFEVDYLLIKSASLPSITVGQTVPEPATMTLLALSGLAMLRRR